ncbi:MAG: HAMP domain-containing sensor histidine kinase [Actinomycetes bacterium]
MSLRWKFSLILGLLAACAALAASAVGYLATRNQLLAQIDDSVANRAERAAGALSRARAGDLGDRSLDDSRERGRELPPVGPPRGGPLAGEGPPLGGDEPGEDPALNRLFIIQTLARDGTAVAVDGIKLPVSRTDLDLAASGVPARATTRTAELKPAGTEVQLAIAPIAGGGAVQVARSIEETSETLNDLLRRLLLITVGVIVASVLVGLLLARRATSSLEHLTKATERVSVTGQPDAEISVSGSDEIGRLGRALSQMLASLARSQEQQQRLVQDAGHELRTPLTSMRTNIAVLDRFDRLDEEQRTALLSDLRSETSEMATLVDELVELSVGSDSEPVRSVDLARLVSRAAERTARRSGRAVEVHAEPVTIEGRPRGLERAVTNLLDNAAKFDRSGGPIELTLTGDSIEVADRGPGIPEDERELVFERFHRSVEARNTAGSGLGLSIVSQVAEVHGGRAFVREREGGGAIVGFTYAANRGDQ